MINVDFDDAILAGQVEAIVSEIEKEAQERWPHSAPPVHSPAAGRGSNLIPAPDLKSG